MNRQKPDGNKTGIAPGTKLTEPKKTSKPKTEPKPTAPFKPKHPMGPKFGDRPSIWQSLADILHDKDDQK